MLQIEKRVPKETRDELTRRGHIIEVEPEWSEGRLTAASKDGKRRRAAANPRGMQGYAAGRVTSSQSASVNETNPIIVADNASKLFLDGTVVAFRQLSLAVQARRDHVHRRPERLRQDHAAALHRRPDRDQHRRSSWCTASRSPARPTASPWCSSISACCRGRRFTTTPRSGWRWPAHRPREIKERVAHYLDLVGLAGFEKHYPYQLSGGMQQRVGLVRALAMNPSVLLMDEPFAALDAQTREILQEELLQLMERPEERKTMVFITHSIDEAILLGDRIAVMSARPGRIKEVLDVPFGHPRDGNALRTDPRFGEMRAHIWGELHTARPQLTRTPREVA